MNTENLYPRFALRSLTDALADTPVVLVHGPRQSGKTTLVRHLGKRDGRFYVTFDDAAVVAAAKSDPVGFIADLPEFTILDEIQKVPSIFSAIKLAVDRDRSPGRFLLTGSANVLLLPNLSDSLAGRMEILRLHPLSQCEIAGRESGFIDHLFSQGFKSRSYQRLGRELAERIVAGGYPAALARSSHRRRAVWYRDYIETQIQRDVRTISRITSLDALPRLLALAAGQTARLVNISEMAAAFQLSRPTIRDYLTLLSSLFLTEELAPWHSNRLSRLIKTPKLHIGDTGVAASLLGVDAGSLYQDRPLFGQLLETFVFQELRRQAGWNDEEIRFHHFRQSDGTEVDLVLERCGRQLAGIEVKASSTVTGADFRGLARLRDCNGDRFTAGVLLYDGENSLTFGDRLFAIPFSALWEMQEKI